MTHAHPLWAAMPAAVLATALAMSSSSSAPAFVGKTSAGTPAVHASVTHLPIAFERNAGQVDDAVRYFSRGQGYSLYLTPTEAVFRLNSGASPKEGPPSAHHAPQPGTTAVVRMSLLDANPAPQLDGLAPQEGSSNYLHGNDPAHWQRGIAHFGKVRYGAIYPGIDLVYYGNQQELEYDFVVAAGADPGRIGLQFDGPRKLQVDEAGNLVIDTGHGSLIQHKPVAYQSIDGQRHAIAASYQLTGGNRVSFALGNYDHAQPLVIDPILNYATYFGGSMDDTGTTIAVDASGNTYIAGYTNSLNFPIKGAVQANNAGGDFDVFVSKLNAAGNVLAYSTYLGGSGNDWASSIAIDSSGNAYLTGSTNSVNFPTRSAMQPTLQGTSNGFVTKLNASGNGLVYSTYLGVIEDTGRSIAVDGSGNAYVVGNTKGGFTFLGTSFQPNFSGGDYDGILIKLNAAGNIAWGTYLGGTNFDTLEGVALDSSGNVHVVGYTLSTDFPTVAAPQFWNQGSIDTVHAMFNSNGGISYSSYLGGSQADYGFSIAIDSAQNIYIAGMTYSFDLPVSTPLQARGGNADGFVFKLSGGDWLPDYGVYLGGTQNDEIQSIAVDSAGRAYVAGRTMSPDFPTSSPWQSKLGGGDDGFVARISADGSDVDWASFVGGIDAERMFDIALDAAGNAHVIGRSFSAFPTVSALQPASGGGKDAVILSVGGATPTSLRHRHNDINDDGYGDLLFHNVSTGANQLWSAADNTIQRTVFTLPSSDGWMIAGIGDFDGDHKGDLLWHRASTGANEIWRSGRLSARQPMTAVTNLDWEIAGIGDFDGDKVSDVLWRNRATGSNTVWKHGNYATSMGVSPLTKDWIVAGVGDFDGDGRSDILWRNPTNGNNVIWKGANAANVQTVDAVTASGWKIVGIGDFDGDGRSDILWRSMASGADTIWSSGNSAAIRTVSSATLDWQVASVSDYNGDGKDDILWRNISNGNNSIWRSANSSTRYSIAAMSDQNWKAIP